MGNWRNVEPEISRRGDLIERDSDDCLLVRWIVLDPSIYGNYICEDCGYRTRYINGTPYCNGYDKYIDTYSQVSYDSGTTWSTTATTTTLVEEDSIDCGYVPPATSNDYFAFIPLEDCEFKFSGNVVSTQSNIYRNTVDYSIDSGTTWYEIGDYNNYTTRTVYAGQEIWWRRNYKYGSNTPYGTFRSNGGKQFYVKGNIMSLISANDFSGLTSVSQNYFSGLCANSNVVNASSLLLPATDLGKSCYKGMFSGCQYLTNAPQLPATHLNESCYESMFYGCRSLTDAPVLPASTLVTNCYKNMFNSGIGQMSLNYIKCLATDISASGCTEGWTQYASYYQPTGLFIKSINSSSWEIGENGIPSGWTVYDYDGNYFYRWVDDGYTCIGYNKWQQKKRQVSYNSGSTWTDTGVVSATTLIEVNSEYCGFTPDLPKVTLTYSGGSAYTVNCNSSTVLTSGETRHDEYLYDDVTAVTIGDCVEEIGAYAFLNYTGITSITIPSGITTISKEAFGYCRGLTNVSIPSGVTSIGTYAFRHCSGLQSVTVNRTTPPTLGTHVFDDTNNCTIYVPAASVSTYKSTGNWKLVSSRIQAIP